MWAKARPWWIAVLAGYGLCLSAVLLFPLLGAPLLWLPWVLRRLSGHAEPSTERFGELLGRSALAIPACVFHLCANTLATMIVTQLSLPRTAVVPFVVGTLAGPLVLPWLGASGFMKLALRAALERSFDAWDARGLGAWATHGVAVGALLSWPYLVFAVAQQDSLPDALPRVLFALAGVLLVPAAVGLAVRYAAHETRVPPRRVTVPRAAVFVAITAVLAPFLWLSVMACTRQPLQGPPYPTTTLALVLSALVPVAPVAVLAIIAWRSGAEARTVERRFATLHGAADVAAHELVARGELALQFDDGSSLPVADGDTLPAGYFVADALTSGTRVEVWVDPGSRAAPFRGTTGVGELVAIQPAIGGDIASVLRTPSAWLPWLHAAALVIAAWIWLQGLYFDYAAPLPLDGM